MTDNDIPHPSPLGKTLAAEFLAVVRDNPAIRDEFRAILLTGESDAWQSQKGSPLGPRRHRAAVERFVAAGEPRARIVGRRFELRRDLLDEELAGRGRRQVARAIECETATDDLASELGLEAVG